MTRFRLLGMLVALSVAAFLICTSGVAMSPFFHAIAKALEADLAAVANLFSLLALCWGLSSLVAGALSDKLGRRPILIGAVVVMGIAQIGFASAPTYTHAAAWQMLTGACGGAFMGTVFAAVSDHVPTGERGRALGWVITGQSLSLVFGVPLITLLATLGGWRHAILDYGAVMLFTAIAVAALLPRDPPQSRSAKKEDHVPLSTVMQPRLLLLISAGIMERSCFATVAVYLAPYLQASYGVTLPQLALGLGLVAAGNLVGNMIGGQVADRFPARPLSYAFTAIATAALALPLLLWQPSLSVSLGLGFAYSLANSLGRPPLMTALTDVPSQVRGTVLGLNIACASLGWLSATALGGWLLTQFGFGALAILSSSAACLGAFLAIMAWRAKPAQIVLV
jgi:predicted MFS family arabinose efflux permease